ncbi:MAG TPA: FecR domain-containing protein [Gemmatimonadaceae bacterium]|nr:FecR domain-containing protein [Gemmatimonadaceae bacterium]
MSEPDWVLLERVAVGKGSDADRAAVEQWIGSDPDRRRLFDQIARIAAATRQLSAPRLAQPHFDAAASLARARKRLSRPRRMGWRVSDRWPLAAIAAGLVVAISLGVAIGTRSRRREAPRVFVTARGQRATLRLDDGTQVVLAPASRLMVDGRSATLDGEAFFTVVHDPRTPFVVHAGRVMATDKGTRFDVRAYPEDSTVRVAVDEGQVAVTAVAGNTQPIALAGGDAATVTPSGEAAVDRGVENIGAWTTGRLELHNTPAREAVRALARWYDVDLRLGDSTLAAVPLTASFRDEPVDEVLHIVAVTLGARVRWSGRTVILVRRSKEH